MGSIESTPTPSTTRTATMDEDSGSNNNALMEENRNGNQNRRVRRYSDSSLSDDPWWWEIENENIAFDQVMPSVSMTTATTASNDESEIELSEDFNSLLKIGETVNLTLSDTSGNNNISNDNKRTARITNGLPAATLKEMHSENTNAQKTEYPVNNSINASTINDELLSSAAVTVNNEREQSLEEFKEELRIKRLARQTAVQDLRDEITTLRKQLTTEQALTRRLRSPAGDTDDDCVDGSGEATTTRSAANISITKDIMVDTNAAVAAAREYSCMDADDEDPQSRSRHANIELANAQLALQLANADNLSLRTELGVVQKQVGTLKEVISCCKQMLAVKEEQCTQLKSKLQEIETSFGEQEMKIMSANLRQEYERQLGNIRQLRQLYEERQRISAAEHENLQRLISIKKDELLAEQEKSKNFEERNQTLMKEVENANTQLAIMREECNEHKFEKKAVKEEMAVVNTLFSQMVLGFNGKNNLDIDRLTTMLEENRTLLNDMATKEINCSDGATLPKLLFELVEQAAVGNGASSRSPSPTFEVEVDQNVDADAAKDPTESMTAKVQYDMQIEEEKEVEDAQRDIGATAIDYESADKEETTAAVSSLKSASTKKYHRKNASCKANTSSSATSSSSMQATATLKLHEPEVIGKVATAQEIIGNLPKVWKVLSHLLLSHHKIEQVQFEENGAGEDCYKSVETPNGPKAELSVSKTYIKLKDLILEKKALVKETNRLKTLNCHLDYRLNEQEKRLSAVSLELTKTWHLVGKMQRQHRQLHTQEQILRYQLQQKRRLLTELKDELEYCRRKWAAARAKNDESQEQCDDLRREFAKRKLEDANNSAESGYSDSGPASDEEERAGVVVAASSVGGGFSSGDGNEGGCVGAVGIGGGSNVAACRRKYLKEMFEHKRKIKRMQSTSPGRAGDGGFCSAVGAGDGGGVGDFESVDIVLRWNSAPPTCGWRTADNDAERPPLLETASGGAIPKRGAHSSRSAQRKRRDLFAEKEEVVVDATEKDVDVEPRTERAFRIQRLEEQCKSLIQQVLETSDNRERLEVQLCRFQDEIAPVQYAVPLDEFINRKRIERTKRASSVPATGTLTPREEEYTRKRSERLERLEEESRQLMSHIKRTSDRGHYLRCSLDRIRRGPSREGSFESNTEVDNSKTDETASTTTTITDNDILDTTTAEQEEFVNTIATTTTTITTTTTLNDKSPLTAEEEEYTARRTARLQRLEEDGKQLLASLLRNTERGSTLGNKLDDLHGRYDSSSECMEFSPQVSQDLKPATIEQRIENIEKISTNREERLRILEEEGKQLISRLSNTSERGTQMMNRIAERELNRQARSIATPSKDDENEESVSSSEITKTIGGQNGSNDPNPEATELMPTLKNVACSSIVYEELTDCVTVTTTASQIAAAQQQGAIPKLKPKAQLSAARHKKSRNLANKESKTNENADAETLEEMVKRLKELPFPNREGQDDEDKVKEKQPDQEDQE